MRAHTRLAQHLEDVHGYDSHAEDWQPSRAPWAELVQAHADAHDVLEAEPGRPQHPRDLWSTLGGAQ